jgi:lipoate-protein ligase A
MNWRLIDDISHSAFYNMALDEAITESVRKRLSPPTLRLYQWIKPSISIGRFQHISDVNTDYCMKRDFPVVRRSTGGTAILHGYDLTYSFSARTDIVLLSGGLFKNYLTISNALVTALKSFGLDAKISKIKKRRLRSPLCFKASSYGEIMVSNQKVIGSSQRRYDGVFLQQGTILMDLNVKEVDRIFGRHGSGLDNIGTLMKCDPSIAVTEMRMAIKSAFEKEFNVQLVKGSPSGNEFTHTEKLMSDKYSTRQWNFKR